jgi:signal transduction histidine kinase
MPEGFTAWDAFRAAPDAQVVVDACAVVRLVNVAAEQLFCRTAEQMVGQPLDQLLVGDPTTGVRRHGLATHGGAQWCAEGQPVELGAEPVPATSAIRLPDGRQCPVDLLMGKLAGDPSGLLVVSVSDQGMPGRSRASLEHRVRRLTELEQEHQNLLSDLILAQERERARIAAGVHDDSLQVITAAMLRMQHLRKRLKDPDALELLARVEESMALAADRLRRLIFDFRPPALERAGLAAALRDQLAKLREDAGIEGGLVDRLAAEPPLPARLLLYRITQEALVNVGQHAEADRVLVTLAEQDAGYLVQVEDNGVGIPHTDEPHIPEPGHLGLVLMRERAVFAGGWIRLESPPEGGTVVTFWIPQGADVELPAQHRGGPR